MCTIHIAVEEFDMDTVDLIPQQVYIPFKIELPQYLIENSGVTLDYSNKDAKGEGVQMRFVFKRVIMSEVLTTFLPTILLMIIVYATTTFKPEYFEAALNLNLGVMFVMTTLFVSVMEKLPSTSYLRMVDIWLIYGQLLPFIEVVLLTYMEICRMDGAGDRDRGKVTAQGFGTEKVNTSYKRHVCFITIKSYFFFFLNSFYFIENPYIINTF